MTKKSCFMVLTASEKMPGSCWGCYSRLAVVELEEGFVGRPKMISTHARGVKRIVEAWNRLHHGGRYSAFGIAFAEAQDFCEDLNGQWGEKARLAAVARQ